MVSSVGHTRKSKNYGDPKNSRSQHPDHRREPVHDLLGA